MDGLEWFSLVEASLGSSSWRGFTVAGTGYVGGWEWRRRRRRSGGAGDGGGGGRERREEL